MAVNMQFRPVAGCLIALAVAHAAPAFADEDSLNARLLRRIDELEKRLEAVESRTQEVPSPASGVDAAAGRPDGPSTGNGEAIGRAVLERLEALEKRLGDIETTAVLSSPKTQVKEVRVWVDANGNEHDRAVPGAKEVVTYQRERTYRRQTIEEEVTDALATQAANGIHLGVNSVTTAQAAYQTEGAKTRTDRHIYGLSAADITFGAKSAALNTEFFADVVGIGGSPPDAEIPSPTLLNSQTARLSNNQLSVREAWIRTELLDQALGLSLGRIDLTRHFDKNTVANDESSQFISGALVNNPVLGLASNGLGAVAVYDPKGPYNVKFGVQQSSTDPNTTAPSLSDSLYSLAEVEYIARPFSLPEGHYRVWGRADNSTGDKRYAAGLSFDQKLTPAVGVFARYGNGYVGSVKGRVHFYSAGLQLSAPYSFHPNDFWGVGYARTDTLGGDSEKLAEAYYNLHLTEHMRASFMLQYVFESDTRNAYVLPGARLQVSF